MFNIYRMILTISCVFTFFFQVSFYLSEPCKISHLCDIYKCETGFGFNTLALVLALKFF